MLTNIQPVLSNEGRNQPTPTTRVTVGHSQPVYTYPRSGRRHITVESTNALPDHDFALHTQHCLFKPTALSHHLYELVPGRGAADAHLLPAPTGQGHTDREVCWRLHIRSF